MTSQKKLAETGVLFLLVLGMTLASLPAVAGSPTPTGPPSAPGPRFTLGDVYLQLTTGANPGPHTGGFMEPSSGPPVSTAATVDQILSAAPTVDATNGATAGQVLAGKTFWGLQSGGGWGVQTGTLATKTLSASSTAVASGYYAATTLDAADTDLKTANIRAGVNIFGIDGATNVVDTTTGTAAAPGDVLSGKTAYANGGLVTGTMPVQTLSPSSTTVAAGYYALTDLVTVDGDLVAGNIKSGTNIFGVAGTYPLAQTGKTGQTQCTTSNVLGTCPGVPARQDAEMNKGIAWTSATRFTAANGVVTDNLTGLIWLQNANCANATRNWATAFADVGTLNSAGTMNGNACGDTSNGGSRQTDWRLPNVREQQSLIDYGNSSPALPTGHPFTAVQNSYYWTSSAYVSGPASAWLVGLPDGYVGDVGKASSSYVWPVLGGQ